MLAQTYALITSIMFALNLVIMRRSLLSSGVYLGVFFSLIIGSLFFLISSLLTGEIANIYVISNSILLFVLAGLFHFVIGRSLLYSAISTAGSNISTPITTLNHVYAALIGILFLGESREPIAYLGLFLIAIGIIVLGRFSFNMNRRRGFYLALAASLFYALTHILIKFGLRYSHTPILGAFISYIAALFVYFFLYGKYFLKDVSNTDRRSLLYLIIAGILVNIGQLFRYLALNVGDVSLVTPIFSTIPLFTLLFSFILNRRLEYFAFKVVASSIIIVCGITLIQMA